MESIDNARGRHRENTVLELRSIELELPDPPAAAAFLAGPWGALDAVGDERARFIRGTAALPYLVALHAAPAQAVRSVTFSADPARIDAIARRAGTAGWPLRAVQADEPGGGRGIEVRLPEGERFRFLHDLAPAALAEGSDAPVKLTHVVLNSIDAERTASLCETVLGFAVSDRTVGMVFVRCNDAHHSVAFARAGFASLNHIAFEMADLDAVMRGMGRMRDIGLAPAWGPGRHGPGANVFAYYVAPFGAVVEFSTAVDRVADDHRAGDPQDWTWPPNRIDQWGISDKAVDALRAAEAQFRFRPWDQSKAEIAA